MEKKGIRPERLQPEWISAAEGVRFISFPRTAWERGSTRVNNSLKRAFILVAVLPGSARLKKIIAQILIWAAIDSTS